VYVKLRERMKTDDELQETEKINVSEKRDWTKTITCRMIDYNQYLSERKLTLHTL